MSGTKDADVRRLVGQAVAQGFPEKCSDPVVMAKITVALNGGAGSIKKKRPKKAAA